jgi:hypothetical protein
MRNGFEPESDDDVRSRIRHIRAGLPGQLRQERLATAALLYGPLCSLDDVHRRIACTLPRVFGSVRRTKVAPIDRAEIFIPDEVLLKYDDAVQLGVFSRFLVVTPAYYWSPRGDPWLVGEVEGTDRWAFIVGWRRTPASWPDLLDTPVRAQRRSA